MARKYFGTDGIRGRVGQAPITPDFFLHLGWAVGKVLAGEFTSDAKKYSGGRSRFLDAYVFADFELPYF